MKFKDSDIGGYDLIKCEIMRPCIVCKENTHYLEFCCEGRLCSKECYDKFYDMVDSEEGNVD